MRASWHQTLVHRLIGNAHPRGGWAYREGNTVCAEPTAVASLALAAHDTGTAAAAAGLAWLATDQRLDGCVPVSPQVKGPGWPTGLAVLAWTRTAATGPGRYRTQIDQAVGWLLATRGRRVAHAANVLGHDTSLRGWPWVEGTHSWAEPTAYAILALRAAKRPDHPRVREGMELALNRCIPGGGWNYGNPQVLGTALKPFPSTTGIVLSALAGEPTGPRINASIEYLQQKVRSIRAPWTLAWGIIGLTAWNARPREASQWLAECAEHVEPETLCNTEAALLLLADAKSCALIGDPHHGKL